MIEQKTDRYFGTLTHIAGPIYEVDPGSVILTLVTLVTSNDTNSIWVGVSGFCYFDGIDEIFVLIRLCLDGSIGYCVRIYGIEDLCMIGASIKISHNIFLS